MSFDIQSLISEREGHVNVLARLLDAGINVSPRAKNGATPLHLASRAGHTNVVQLLIEHGANAEEKDELGTFII